MNRYFSVFADHRTALIIFFFLAILSLFFPVSSSAASEIDAGQELISLSVKDEPLGDVLYKVSMATGYDISLDNKWQNYRVTASLEQVPLQKGLKRILKNLNSAIIYVSSKKIKIIIFDKTASGDASFSPSNEKSPDRTPGSQRPTYRSRNQQHPLPTSQAIEKENSSGTNDEPLGNPAVSDQGSEVSTPDNEGEENTTSESLKAGPDEGTYKDLENKSSEENPENDNQTESKNE